MMERFVCAAKIYMHNSALAAYTSPHLPNFGILIGTCGSSGICLLATERPIRSVHDAHWPPLGLLLDQKKLNYPTAINHVRGCRQPFDPPFNVTRQETDRHKA